MWQKKLPVIFLSVLFGGGVFVYWNALIDPVFLPRVFFVGLVLLLFFPLTRKIILDGWSSITWADILFAVYCLMHFVSIVPAVNKAEALFEAERMFIVLITYLIFRFALVKQIIQEKSLLQILLAISIIYVVYGALQYYFLIQEKPAIGDNLYAVNGLSGHKNHYTAFMMCSCLVLLAGWWQWGQKWRTVSTIVIFSQLVLIALLQTRSIYLGLIAAGSFCLVGLFIWRSNYALSYIKRSASLILLVGLVVWLTGWLTGSWEGWIDRMNIASYFRSDTSIERLSMWYKTYCLLKDHWILGVGGRNWTIIYPYYSLYSLFRPQYLHVVFLQPHNDYLWIWSETGVFGFSAFLGCFISYIVGAIRYLKSVTLSEPFLSALLLTAGLIAFMVHSFFDFPKERMELQLMMILMMSMLGRRIQGNLKSFSLLPVLPFGILVVGLLFLVTSVFGMGIRLNADSYMKEMNEARQQNDHKVVIEVCETMKSPFCPLCPNGYPKAWYQGVAAYQLHDVNRAYAYFLEAYPLAPYNHDILNNLGGMETYYKHYDRALDYYRETLRINPRDDDARFNVAYTLYFLGRYSEALDTLKQVWSDSTKKAEFVRIISAKGDSTTH